jgi:hypothetical protein
MVRGSSALFANSYAQSTMNEEVIWVEVRGNGPRVQSLRQIGMQAGHAPMDCGHAGEGHRLCAASKELPPPE